MHKKELMIAGLLFAGVLALDFPFLIQNLTLDSVDYIEKMMYGSTKELFHPHHLTYNLLGRWVYQVWTLVGWEGSGVLPVVSLNMVLGAGGVTLFFLICNSLFRDYLVALGCSLLLAFSYGYWFYSLVAEPHLPGLFLLLLTFYLLIGKGRSTPKRWLFYLGINHGLAVLLHQSIIIFSPVLLTGILQRARPKSYWHKVKSCLIYLAGLGLVAGVPYIWIAWSLDRLSSPGDFLRWVTYYHSHYVQNPASSNSFGWGEFHLANIWQAASYGLGRAIIFGTPIREIVVQKVFHPKGLVLVICCLIVILLVSFSYVYMIVRSRLLWEKFGEGILLSLIWFASLGAFLTYWSPKAIELAIPLLIPFWILLSLPYVMARELGANGPRKNSPLSILPIILTITLFLTNFGGEIFPNSRPLNNETRHLSESIHRLTSPGDILLMPPAPISLVTPNWFTDNQLRVISLSSLPEMTTEKDKELALAKLQQQIEQAIQNQQHVFLAEHELHPIRLGYYDFQHYQLLYSRYIPYLHRTFDYYLFGRRYWMYEIRIKG